MPSPAPISLFIGRFQPFHTGHLMVLKGMVKLCDKVVIGIGSADAKRSAEDPFTFDERRDMIQRALQDENIIPAFNVNLVPLSDHASDEKWVQHCVETVGDISTVWTGRADVKAAFEKAGIAVKDIKEVPGISAHEVRRRIQDHESTWRELVPEAVGDFMDEIRGVERIRELAGE